MHISGTFLSHSSPPRALTALHPDRQGPIATSATTIARSIRSKTPSIEKITEILRRGNIVLKHHLDHPSKLNGSLRADAKKYGLTKFLLNLEWT